MEEFVCGGAGWLVRAREERRGSMDWKWLFCGVNSAMKLEQRFNTDVECEVASEEARLLVGVPEQEIQRLVNSEPRSALLMDIAVD